MLKAKKIKENILSLENKYPVDEWKIDDIYIWPYIRIKLFIDLLKYSNPNFEHGEYGMKKSKIAKKSKFKKAKLLVDSFLYLQKFKSNLIQKDIVYFGAHFHRTKVDGKYFNRFFDSLNYLYDLDHKHYTFEFLKIYPQNHNQDSILNLTSILNAYRNYTVFKNKILLKRNKIKARNLEEYDEFLEEIIKLNPKISVDHYSVFFLKRKIIKINQLMLFFNKFYLKVKPKYVIYAGYYGYDALYASILSANRLNIKTVDIQHGPQTNTHMVFTEWQKIPLEGYNLMPVEYWNWDDYSVNNIKKWSSIVNINSKCIGQPYIEYFKKNNSNKIIKKDQILYSFQAKPFNIEDFIQPKIIQLIKQLKLKWVFRLHPSSHISKEEVIKYCKQKNIYDRILVQDSKDYALPLSILESKWHITHFSGCVIESRLLETPSIIINEFGKTIYQSYIDDNAVYYNNIESASFIDDFKDIIKSKTILLTDKSNDTLKNPFELLYQ